MNSIHYSKGIALAVLLAIAVLTAGTAAAISISGDAPAPSEEGTEVSLETTIESPMADQPSQWTLRGETELVQPTWYVEVRDSAGNTISEQQSVESSEVTQDLSDDPPVPDEITVRVTGTVPEIGTDDFDYENMDAENYTVMHLSQGGERTLESGLFESHRVNSEGKHLAARQALDNASAAIADSDNEEASEQLDRAISLYNSGDFEQAISTAEDAETTAEGSGTSTVLLIAAAVVVLLVIVGGFFYNRRSQQDSGHKLQ